MSLHILTLKAPLLYARKSSQNPHETPAPKGIIGKLCSGSRWPIFLLQALLSSLFPRSQCSDTIVPFSSAISIVSIDWSWGNSRRRTKCEFLPAFLISAGKDKPFGGWGLLLELSVIMGCIFLSLLLSNYLAVSS